MQIMGGIVFRGRNRQTYGRWKGENLNPRRNRLLPGNMVPGCCQDEWRLYERKGQVFIIDDIDGKMINGKM
jgi:hypothetical protein